MNKYPESLHDRCKYLERVIESLKEVISSNDKYIASLRLKLKTQGEFIEKEHEYSRLWVWQSDGYDYLRSMANDLPVLIRADDLRYLVENGEFVAEESGSDPVGPSILRLAEATKDLMQWQVKNVNKWNNPAYDNAVKLLKELGLNNNYPASDSEGE